MLYSLVIMSFLNGYPLEVDKYTFDTLANCENAILTAKSMGGNQSVSGAQVSAGGMVTNSMITLFCVQK